MNGALDTTMDTEARWIGALLSSTPAAPVARPLSRMPPFSSILVQDRRLDLLA
jgi:hypothetical protein